MKIRFVSMRKYKMRLGWKYRLKNFVEIKKYWSGKLISLRIMCECGFDIDLRHGTFIDWMLTDEENKSFWMRINFLGRKN